MEFWIYGHINTYFYEEIMHCILKEKQILRQHKYLPNVKCILSWNAPSYCVIAHNVLMGLPE